MTIEELQLGRNGQYLVTGTSAVDLTSKLDGTFVIAVVNEDAVISALTDKADVNMVTESNLTGATISAGTILSPRKCKQFKSVTLTSGSIMFYQDWI